MSEEKTAEVTALVEALDARQAEIVATPKDTGIDHLYLIRRYYDGVSTVVTLDLQDYAPNARRAHHTQPCASIGDMLRYLDKHGDPDQVEVEVNRTDTPYYVFATLDAGTREGLGRRNHVAKLSPHATQDWRDWFRNDGKKWEQCEFAEFIEEHDKNIVSPPAAAMLELAQTMSVTVNADFSSAERLQDGATQFSYRENMDAKAGKAGQLTIPQTITLVLQPFEELDRVYKMTARLRYRLSNRRLTFSYHLDRPQDVMRDAFAEMVKPLAEQDKWLVFGLE